jgi:hypothetical protein
MDLILRLAELRDIFHPWDKSAGYISPLGEVTGIYFTGEISVRNVLPLSEEYFLQTFRGHKVPTV